jgi:hypothetical protein
MEINELKIFNWCGPLSNHDLYIPQLQGIVFDGWRQPGAFSCIASVIQSISARPRCIKHALPQQRLYASASNKHVHQEKTAKGFLFYFHNLNIEIQCLNIPGAMQLFVQCPSH